MPQNIKIENKIIKAIERRNRKLAQDYFNDPHLSQIHSDIAKLAKMMLTKTEYKDGNKKL